MTMHALALTSGQPVPSGVVDDMTGGEIAKELGRRAKLEGMGYHFYPILVDDVPKTFRSFTTWSLFLISNPAWLRPDTTKIVDLYAAYLGFARAIGGSHAAVWFGTEPRLGKDDDFAAHIDAERCASLAAQLGLDLTKSPHVVVSTKCPKEDLQRSSCIILELNGISVQSTDTLLATLANQLIAEKLDQKELSSARWWLSWKDATLTSLRAVPEALGRVRLINIEEKTTVSTTTNTFSGTFSGTNLIVSSTLTNVSQTIDALSSADKATKDELMNLVVKLHAELQKLSTERPDRKDHIDAVAVSTEELIVKAKPDQPNRTLLQAAIANVKNIAKSLEDVAPSILTAVTTIASVIAKLHGL